MTRAPRERWALAAVLVGFLLVSIVPLVAHGALGIARNDDWDFSRSLFASVQAGRLVVDPWTSAMLWGHLLWAWPLVEVLGESRAALQVATIAIGTLALLTLHGLLRRWTPAWVATTTVAVTALGPLYPPLAGSYMTDVPAFALQVMALEAGARALSGARIRWAWWSASLGLCLAGFTVREYSIVVLAGLAAGFHVRWPGRRELAWAGASLGLWVGLAATLFWLRVSSTAPVWAAEVDGARPRVVDSLAVGGEGLATLSMLTMVALPWIVAHLISIPRTPRAVVTAVSALVGAGMAVTVWFIRDPFVPIKPSYLSSTPAYSETLGGTAPAWMPVGVWHVIGLGSLLGAGCLAVVVVTWGAGCLRHRRRRANPGAGCLEARVTRTMCLTFLTGGVALVVAVGSARGFPIFDRYFLPLAPFLVAAVLSLPIDQIRLRRAATACVALLGAAWSLWGIAATDAAATNDALRWSVGRELSEQGWSPSTVDAGYEWWGAHQPDAASTGPPGTGPTFWTGLFPESAVCVQASYASPGRTPEGILLTRSARTLTGTEIVVVARVVDPSCARPTPSVGP